MCEERYSSAKKTLKELFRINTTMLHSSEISAYIRDTHKKAFMSDN